MAMTYCKGVNGVCAAGTVASLPPTPIMMINRVIIYTLLEVPIEL